MDRDFHSMDSVVVGGRLLTHERRHHSREHYFEQHYRHDNHLTSIGDDRTTRIEDEEELENELTAPEVLDDMPPT